MGYSSGIGVGSQKTGVCTSTSRPSSPFEGQMIYETDTDILAIWNGTAWKQLAAATKTGSPLQVVNTIKTDDWVATTGTTFTDVTGLSASITPSSTSNKVLVVVTLVASADVGNFGYARILRGATEVGSSSGTGSTPAFGSVLGDYGTSNSNYCKTISTSFLDSPSTTSTITYKIQMCHHQAGGIVSVNRRAGYTGVFGTSTITLTEIAG